MQRWRKIQLLMHSIRLSFPNHINWHASHSSIQSSNRLRKMEEIRVDPVLGPKRPAITENGSSSSSKRVKVEQHDILPDSALLYNFAYSTWQCANRHLSQTFVPASVQPIPSDPSMIHLTDPMNPTTSKTYEPDARAAEKALSLQILAIDTLKIGLGLSSLSDTERVTFGLLFGKIGIQVIQALRAADRKGKGKEAKGVHHQKLLQDIEEQVNISVRIPLHKDAYTNDRWHLLAKALISCYYANSLSC
jgi:hypothetical protein